MWHVSCRNGVATLVTYLLFTRCVENVIRASERVSKLESRLAAAERDRDAARLRLGELQQNNSPARTCQHCLQLNDSPMTAGALLLLLLLFFIPQVEQIPGVKNYKS